MKKTRSKGRRKRSWDRQQDDDERMVPVMQVNTKWGNDRSLYYEGEGDSGTSSDEENMIDLALDEERKHIAALDEKSFKLFSNVKNLEESPATIESIDDLEKTLSEEQLETLRKTVRSVVRDVTDAAREISYGFSDTQADQARKQLLLNLLTNGCFYLHLVGNGMKQPTHPALEQIKRINELLSFGGNDGEEHLSDVEEEEEEAEAPKKDDVAVPEKHIPVHLQKIEEGEFRAVTRNILKNQIIIPNKPSKSKAPRSKRRQKYAHAMHEYNKTHKRKNAPRIYNGEMAGISKFRSKSTKLHPAH